MGSTKKKRYAMVGTGGRVLMFLDPVVSDYKNEAELVGLCDLNAKRLQYHTDRLKEKFGITDIPTYSAADFDKMISEQKPDVVVVCTVDATHDEYIVRALDAGCDVITEKPLTTDEKKCKRIFDAVERSGHTVQVTFNMRWGGPVSKVRELIAEGAIGNVKSVVLEYMLDTSHGADYFRRWHSDKSQSGGLLVHKSTHHFDMVNWWLDSIPEKVFAFGNLAFYGRQNALDRGQKELTEYDRYTGKAPDSDPFKLTLDNDPALKGLYLDAEPVDGYLRDKNVFREGIDIEDSVGAVVRYRNGITLTYSLTAFCPIEGYRVSFNGDKGRLEYIQHHNSHIIRGQSNEELASEQRAGHDSSQAYNKITVYPLFKPPYEMTIEELPGGHGGCDPAIQKQIFSTNPPTDPLGKSAGHEQGAASALIGIAANRSIATGQPVNISDLLNLRPECTKLQELK
ncbi:MAG: Gfo/Idh/MocA family oxidoreductase [Chthoniobacterales bacterium]